MKAKKILSIVFTGIAFAMYVIGLWFVISLKVDMQTNSYAGIGLAIAIPFMFIFIGVQTLFNILGMVFAGISKNNALKIMSFIVNGIMLAFIVAFIILLYTGVLFG